MHADKTPLYMPLVQRREELIKALRYHAQAQEEGRIEDMYADFKRLDVHDDDTLESPEALEAFSVAWRMWESWVDEAGHRFPGFYPPMTREQWPALGRNLADALEGRRPITDAVALENAMAEAQRGHSPSLLSRLWRRIRGGACEQK